MAITNLYSNLPAHLVEFKDGGMQLRETAVTGNSKSLLIIGTAIDGPVNEPVAIDVENVQKLFGDDINSNGIPNGTTLTKYARQAYKAGFNDIRCMRVTGSSASAVIETATSVISELVEETLTLNAGGNKEYEFSLYSKQANGQALTSDQYAVYDNVIANHSDAGQIFNKDIDSVNAKVTISKNTVPARGSIKFEWTPLIVDTANLTAVNATVANIDTSTGVNIVEITVPAITDAYEYALTTVTGFAEDLYGIPVTAGDTMAVVTNIGDIFMTLVLKDTATSTKVNILSATKNADDTLTLTFEDTAATVTTADAYTVEYVSVVNGMGESEIVSDFYDAQEKTIDSVDKIPATGEEVILYDATGKNVIAKMSDGNGVITYNAVDNKFIIDLSKVNNTIPLGYITVGASMNLVYNYELNETITESITFRSTYGGEVYNEARVTVDIITNDAGEEGRLITLIKPDSKKYSVSEAPLSFTSFDYPTFGLLRDALAAHELNNVFEAVTDFEDAPTNGIPVGTTNSLSMNFTGGTNGVSPTNDEMFVALSGKRDEEGYLVERGAYQILENYHVDYIYVAGVYADSKVSPSISKNNFHYELALLCAVLTYRTKMVHGFMDVKPNTNTTLVGIQNYVEKLLAYDNVHYMRDNNGDIIYDENNNPMDIGWYTSVVVGPEPICTSPTLGNYYGSPAIAYAALNANLKAQSAPTNKALPGCTGMRYKFSNKQLNDLTGNRFVTFKLKSEGVTSASKIPYVVDGCTSGTASSDYARLTTVKVVTRCVDEIREVADPFIGEPNTVEQRNALAALISKRLSYLKEQGVIQYFEFEISATVQQVLIGECSIALTLVAPQELRKITTVVALRATA